MAYVIGIDTGGTYTDAVFVKSGTSGPMGILKKAKALTTHENLELGIAQSISSLGLSEGEIEQIEKIVLSTTLATNAIVEGNLSSVGLILIGSMPPGEVACEHIRTIDGLINIKGRILQDVKKQQVEAAVTKLTPDVDAFAISCPASVRNPLLEQKVKDYIVQTTGKPVICGHELASGLGFLERTNTAVINAGLLPIITRFIRAIETVLAEYHIDAPIFVVKGDGTNAKLEAIRMTPIDTALSGPAASMIGTTNLTGLENAVISDMGGTTTDTGTVIDNRVELSPDGALVGKWKLMIRSANLNTFGLGGDSCIRYEDGELSIGPDRVLPACRGGKQLTPTDIVHYTGEYVNWDREASAAVVDSMAKKMGVTVDECVDEIKRGIAEMIYNRFLERVDPALAVCAIGAPAETWYQIAREFYDFNLVVPPHYEVANAVGAAVSGIQEEVTATIRKGEEGRGYLVHAKNKRRSCRELNDAVKEAIDISRELAEEAVRRQNLQVTVTEIEGETQYQKKGDFYSEKWFAKDSQDFTYAEVPVDARFVELKIAVRAGGNIFGAAE